MPSVLSHPQFHNEEAAYAWVEEPPLAEWPRLSPLQEGEPVGKLAGKGTWSRRRKRGCAPPAPLCNLGAGGSRVLVIAVLPAALERRESRPSEAGYAKSRVR